MVSMVIKKIPSYFQIFRKIKILILILLITLLFFILHFVKKCKTIVFQIVKFFLYKKRPIFLDRPKQNFYSNYSSIPLYRLYGSGFQVR